MSDSSTSQSAIESEKVTKNAKAKLLTMLTNEFKKSKKAWSDLNEAEQETLLDGFEEGVHKHLDDLVIGLLVHKPQVIRGILNKVLIKGDYTVELKFAKDPKIAAPLAKEEGEHVCLVLTRDLMGMDGAPEAEPDQPELVLNEQQDQKEVA